MRSLSLRARILIVASALIVALTAATLAYVSVLADRVVTGRLQADLERGRQLVVEAEAERYRRLELTAQLVASFPALRALLGTDSGTIRDFLAYYRQGSGWVDLLMVLDPQGRVIARSDSVAPLEIPDVATSWIQPALDGRSAAGVLDVDGRLFHAAAAVAEAGGTVLGFVVAAAPADDEFARRMRDASGDDIVLLAENGLAGSTLRADRLPWRTLGDWRARTEGRGLPHEITMSGETFVVTTAGDAASGPLLVVTLQSKDVALAPYRRIQAGLLVLGLLAAGAGIGGSAFLARSITAPIARLVDGTRQVASGNFDVRIDTSREDELGVLAHAFNEMTEGLRQRADMQKFVSQSTVRMIQKRERQTTAGERRVITVLFSDIRGFSALAERRSPEEAVLLLNRVLRVQADLVKRFSGDVDKFIGDAVFALFAGPDMALDAIRCGVEIHRALASEALGNPGEPSIEVGVGIATGEVLLGSIGSADRLDYTAVGATVNLCSRLCSMAGPREILLSDETYARVRDLVAAEPLPAVAVKGLSRPVAVLRMRVQ
jgi:class 3 adenylate cyclase